MRTLRTIAPALALSIPFVLAGSAHAADWRSAGAITPPTEIAGELTGSVDAAGNSLFFWTTKGTDLNYRARPRGGPFGTSGTLTTRAQAPSYATEAANGDVAAAWIESREVGEFHYPILRAALRTGGADFGPPRTVYDAGEQNTLCFVETAIADNGEAILAFGVSPRQPTGGPCRLYLATRAPGADRFGPPQQVTDADTSPPRIAMDARGNGLIAWRTATSQTVQVARHPAGGGFTPPQSVGVGGEIVPRYEGPLVLRVAEPTGRAVLGFPSGRAGRRVHVAAAVGDTTNGFPARANVLSGPADLGSGQLGAYFDGDAGADGTLALTWRSSGRRKTRTQAAYVGPRATRITAARTRSVSGYGVQVPRVAVTRQGRVTVTWVRLVRSNVRALEATTAFRGGFARAERIRSSRVASRPNPIVETNSRGDQWVVWARTGNVGVPGLAIESSRASARSGRFGRIIPIARSSGRDNTVTDMELYRGASGAMLAAVLRTRENPTTLTWELHTNGER